MKLLKTLLALLLLVAALPSGAQEAGTTVKKITVGVKPAPPFIIQKANNTYTGVSIELWERIANEASILYDYKFYPPDEIEQMLKDVENGTIDLSINPVTVTSERLMRFDFTQPFYSSSLAIAVKTEKANALLSFLKKLLSPDFIRVVMLLATVILIFGLVLWLVERRANPDEFATGLKGLADGFWWSAVTMTTVGYGDKSPRTAVGRIIAVIWMFTAVIIISSFTGSIAASLTVSEIQSDIKDLSDLQDVRVGTMPGSSAEKYLNMHKINTLGSESNSVAEGLHDLQEEKIDAFVYDEPILNYTLKQENAGGSVSILPYHFNEDYYSFCAPHNSPLIDKINHLLIASIEGVSWLGILNEYNLQK